MPGTRFERKRVENVLYGRKFALQRTIDLFHSSIKPSMRTIGSCGGLCTCRGTHSRSTRARATQQGDMTAGKNGEDRSTPALLLKGAYVTFLRTHLYGKACI